MVATIVAVVKSRGILATHWEFDFTIKSNLSNSVERTLSIDEAVEFAKRSDLGPVAEMCRVISVTPSVRYAELVGMTFEDADVN